MAKSYIKNLTYLSFNIRNKKYLSVTYDRNGEFNDYTIEVDKKFSNEKEVRKFINKQ
jgi:hypothetical protein